jgi:hypothetical protein
MTHTEALEGGFIPEMYVDTQKTFTASELLMYKHTLNTGIDQYIPVHTSTYQYILTCIYYVISTYKYIPPGQDQAKSYVLISTSKY